MAPIKTDNWEKVEVASVSALRDWLFVNHAQPESIWLVTWKSNHPDKYVDREAVLDELICFGWIDGIRRKLDEDRTMQLISPRKQQAWAKSYKDRAARMIVEDRMAPSGLASVEAGKASGLWQFFDDVDALIVPSDLQAELKACGPAASEFAAFSDSATRNILRWIKIAKTETTRKKRISTVAALAAEGKKPPQM